MQPFKNAPLILGMQRKPTISKRTGKVSKHRASSPSGLCCEAAPLERASVSETLDRSRTPLNVNLGPESGAELWQSMVGEADAARIRMVNKKGEECERGLRKDAVIGYAWLDHPPVEVTRDWDDDTMMRFTNDSMEAANDVLESMGRPRMFGHGNERATYLHKDEAANIIKGMLAEDSEGIPGLHVHRFGMCQDPETGAWCGSNLDAAFFSRLNKDYPRLMRERGWPVLDMDTTDWERYNSDLEYRAERDHARKSHGISTNEYRAAQRVKQARDEVSDVLDDVAELRHSRAAAEDDAEQARAEAEQAAREHEAEAAMQAKDIERGRLALTLQEAASKRLADEEEASKERAAKARDDEKRARDDKAKADEELAKAKADVSHQRDLAEWLGPKGSGVVYNKGKENERHERSVRQVRAERDKAKAEADEAAKRRDDAQRSLDAIDADIKAKTALADSLDADIVGKRETASSLDDELAAARADEAAAKAEADRQRGKLELYAHGRTFSLMGFARRLVRRIERAIGRALGLDVAEEVDGVLAEMDPVRAASGGQGRRAYGRELIPDAPRSDEDDYQLGDDW